MTTTNSPEDSEVHAQATGSTKTEDEPYSPFIVGIRVSNVRDATDFYQRLGFKQYGTIPDEPGDDGTILESFLAYDDRIVLIVGAIEGPPYPVTERERNIKAGPRGLGVKLGLSVPDLDTIYGVFKGMGCEITTEPMEEFWGVRLFTALDIAGYEWQITQTINEMTPEEGAAAAKAAWSLE